MIEYGKCACKDRKPNVEEPMVNDLLSEDYSALLDCFTEVLIVKQTCKMKKRSDLEYRRRKKVFTCLMFHPLVQKNLLFEYAQHVKPEYDNEEIYQNLDGIFIQF